uniref:Uncharacterized protein n=1 Tax=Anguilla anguilla TaxID=7936 RepID=A0A0E9RMD3_ANGAN
MSFQSQKRLKKARCLVLDNRSNMHSEILKNTVWKKQHIIQQFCTKDPCNSQRKNIIYVHFQECSA